MPEPRTGPSRRPASTALVVVAIVAAGFWLWTRPAGVTSPAASTTASSPGATTPAAEPRAESAEPSHDLSIDEAHGGHTLARHVGRSDAELRERLRREPDISAASTYTDRVAAETTVARALAQNESRIAAWMAREGTRPNLALDYRGGMSDPIGLSLNRHQRDPVACFDAVVVLRWNGREAYVLTSYPEARR